MDQSDNKSKDANEDLAQDCSGVPSTDPDDATAIAGNQQEGCSYEPEFDSRIDPVNQSFAAATTSGCNQNEAGEKQEDRKISAETDSARPSSSSFAQMVKSWETYISDAQNVDTFQPMQMLQNLSLCGGHELPRLTLAPSTDFTNTADGQDPFEPIILRHTHSTPLQYRPSFLNDYDGSGMPPPAALNPERRSSSTPSRGSAFQQFSSSARSAFGAHIYSTSNLSGSGGRSAFGFPMHRSAYSGVSTGSGVRSSAFNPVPSSLSTTLEEPQQEENTSIEVMDLGREERSAQSSNAIDAEEKGEVELQIQENDVDQAKPKKSAAARAAQFLTDVGVLRKKKKGARSSIVSVISTDTTSRNTGTKDETENKESKNHVATDDDETKRQESDSEDREQGEDFAQSSTPMYHQLDSDVDEEFDRYQSIENSGRDSDESPPTVSPPGYHPMEDDRVATKADMRRPAVRIQVSSNMPALPQIAERIANPNCTTSPNPDQLVPDDHSNTLSSSAHSPGGATRSSVTTNTSGHTTQATSTTSTTGNGSQSQISETDREVMETIKEGKRRRRQATNPAIDKNCNDGTGTIDSSSSSASSTTHGYVALSGSPGPLRDGANVVADRFFRHSQQQGGAYPSCSSSVSTLVGGAMQPPYANARGRTLSSLYRKSNSNGSPTTCSLSSIEETPPTFVSYLDRQGASDLTSLRAATEVSNFRGDVEEREDSPAEIGGFPAALSDHGQENAMSSVLPKLFVPSTEHLYSMLDKFRSRPPRNSPAKGLRTRTPTTPPPRLASPAPLYQHHQLSPPRKIVDHRVGSNVSRPYVVRTNPSTQKVILVSPGSVPRPTTPLVCLPVGSPNYSPNQNRPLTTWQEQAMISPYGNSLMSRTYEEHSIEILKTDSKDEMICQR